MKTKTPTPSQLHSPLSVLEHVQGVGYPHPVVIRAKESADGPVKIATVHHTASYSAQEMAAQIVTACNSLPALRSALEVALAALTYDGSFPLRELEKRQKEAQQVIRQALAQSGERGVVPEIGGSA